MSTPTPVAPSPRRTLLGTAQDLGSRHRIYETAEAVELDEASGFTVTRQRVFYDEVVLVTLHGFVGWPLGVLLAMIALFAGSGAALLAVGDALAAAVALGVVALVFAALSVTRFVVKVEAVGVYGKRSRAQVCFWLRHRKARAVFSRLCARALQAQERAPAPSLPQPPEPTLS